jgi:hypothetical protein
MEKKVPTAMLARRDAKRQKKGRPPTPKWPAIIFYFTTPW